MRPIAYAAEPPFTELADLVSDPTREGESPEYAVLGRAVDTVAGLTAVDGATLITDRYELLAFGVKIGRPDGRLRVERVVVTEPIEGAAVVLAPLQLGGTRHISAAQFARDQQDAVGPGGVPGRALHRVRVVGPRRDGARPSRGDTAALRWEASGGDARRPSSTAGTARTERQGQVLHRALPDRARHKLTRPHRY